MQCQIELPHRFLSSVIVLEWLTYLTEDRSSILPGRPYDSTCIWLPLLGELKTGQDTHSKKGAIQKKIKGGGYEHNDILLQLAPTEPFPSQLKQYLSQTKMDFP